jgi:hypothetical protein
MDLTTRQNKSAYPKPYETLTPDLRKQVIKNDFATGININHPNSYCSSITSLSSTSNPLGVGNWQ